MAVAQTYAPLVYTGNGATVSFPVTWEFFADSDLLVTLVLIATGAETVQTLATHYDVTGGAVDDDDNPIAVPGTGAVVFLSAPSSSYKVRIERVTALTQGTSFTSNDAFPPKTVEGAYDRRAITEQETRLYGRRAVKQSIAQYILNGELALPDLDDGNLIGWGASGLENMGTPTELDLALVSDYILTLIDDPTAAAARATLELATTTTDNAACRFDGTSGKTQNSGVIIDDNNCVTVGNGTAGTPGVNFASDTDCGLYRLSADVLGWAVAGVGYLQLAAAALSPVVSDATALGTSSLMFSDLFLASGAVLNFNAGNATITHTNSTGAGQGRLALAGAFNCTSATDYVSQHTVVGTGYHKFFKNYTGAADGGTVVNISAFHDANIGGVGTQGSVASFYSGVGYNATATGNSHTLATVMEVRNCANPGGAFMEVAAEFSYVGAQWLDALGGSTPTTYTNDGIGLWGRDYSVVGSPFGQDAYLTSITNYIAKYSATSTVDSLHMGTNGIAVCTLPASGPGFGSRAGQTSYAIDDGFVVTGFAGAVTGGPTDGDSASATEGFTYAFRAGGANGAGWTHQKVYSKIGTAFWGADYTSYGLDLYRRHPSSSARAMYVRDGAGTVGIWSAPPNDDARPLTVGKSRSGEMYQTMTNQSANSAATTGFEFLTDLGQGLIFQTSVAAGGYMFVSSPGDLFLATSAAGKILGLGTNGTQRVKLTDTAFSPTTTDTVALGTTSLMWSDYYAASGHVTNFNNGNVTATHSSGAITWTGVSTGNMTLKSSASTGRSAVLDLTSNTTSWKLLTQDDYQGGTLVVRGGSTDYYLFGTGALAPAASDGVALGTSSLMFSDLFLASGAVVNFNAGNVTLTHSAGVLTANCKLVTSVASLPLSLTNSTDAVSNQLVSLIGANATRAAGDAIYVSFTLANSVGTGKEFGRHGVVIDTTTSGAEDGAHFWQVMVAGTLSTRLRLNKTQLFPVGTVDLGITSTNPFGNLFLGSTNKIDFNNGDVTITHATNNLLFAGASSGYTFDAKVYPTADDGAALGDTTHNFSDLFLASGAVLNYANSNVVITHTSGILTMGTGELRITTVGTNTASVVTVGGAQTLTSKVLTSATITTGLTPTTDDGAALGTTSLQFSDLFLASGGVINWVNGDVTITHATNDLAFAGATQYKFDAKLLVGLTSAISSAYIAEFDKSQAGNTYLFVRNTSNGSGARSGMGLGNDNSNLRGGVFLNGSGSSDYGGAESVNLSNFGAFPVGIVTNNALAVLITSVANVKIGGTASRGTTEGTNQVVIFNGTAPAGTLTNGASFYAASGEMRVMDSAGNSTLLSPHDDDNYWVFDSVHTPTGKRLRIDMERFVKAVNERLGLDFVHEFTEAIH